ncbi:hypothetical protein BKA63DRAFT_497031 [Paraphoma chrysanthemicola]|nr:hypothetical protein BKA63DRAFT_497031 [Paraphoma chrysanthemicola]
MPSDCEDQPTPTSEADAPSAAYKLPKSDVHFAFGSQSWYWGRLGGRWRFPTTSVRSNASDWSTFGINEPYWVAFKHDTGVFMGGCDEDGDARVTHTWNDGYIVESRDAYIKLYHWLAEQVQKDVEKVRDVSISIGPKGSYFARCGTSHIAHALPKDLQKAIEESESPPVSVALGIKGAWILLMADGTRDWNLRHAYPTLASTDNLTDNSNKVVFAALNPYVEDGCFLVAEDGCCTLNNSFSDATEGKEFYGMVDSYMRMRARRDGSTFSHPAVINGVQRQVKITPTSGPQETRMDAWVAMLRARHHSINRKDLTIAGAITGGTGLAAKVAGVPTFKADSFRRSPLPNSFESRIRPKMSSSMKLPLAQHMMRTAIMLQTFVAGCATLFLGRAAYHQWYNPYTARYFIIWSTETIMTALIVFVAHAQRESIVTMNQNVQLEAVKSAVATVLWVLIEPWGYHGQRSALASMVLVLLFYAPLVAHAVHAEAGMFFMKK